MIRKISWKRSLHYLTHKGLDKMPNNLQTTFSMLFFGMKIIVFSIKFHRNLLPRIQLRINQHCSRPRHVAKHATCRYLNHCCLSMASLGHNELTSDWCCDAVNIPVVVKAQASWRHWVHCDVLIDIVETICKEFANLLQNCDTLCVDDTGEEWTNQRPLFIFDQSDKSGSSVKFGNTVMWGVNIRKPWKCACTANW